MRFPRNARIFRGQLDAAPFATVFFLLALFMMLASLVYTPGVQIRLPVGEDLSGTDRPSIHVAMDINGHLYFTNGAIEASVLRERLGRMQSNSSTPFTLVIYADAGVTHEKLIQLELLARSAGITDAWLATLPRPLSPAASPSRK